MKKCRFCAEEIQDAAVVCRFCNRSLSADVPSVAPVPAGPQQSWNAGVAAVLSFVIPGLGQIYKGQLPRGLVFLIITVAGYAMLIVPGIIIHIFLIFDAYEGSTVPQPRTPSPRVAVDLTPEQQRERRMELNRQSWGQMLGVAIALAVVLLLAVLFVPADHPLRPSTTASAGSADSPEWELKLKKMVKSAGQPCVASISAFQQGTDSSGDYWNLRCTDSFTYSIQLVAGQPPKVLACDQFTRTTGIECFTVLGQRRE